MTDENACTRLAGAWLSQLPCPRSARRVQGLALFLGSLFAAGCADDPGDGLDRIVPGAGETQAANARIQTAEPVASAAPVLSPGSDGERAARTIERYRGAGTSGLPPGPGASGPGD